MLLEICERAIDVWSDEAKDMTANLVSMEGDYITSQFFRRLAESRAVAAQKCAAELHPRTNLAACGEEILTRSYKILQDLTRLVWRRCSLIC
mgnify:CR=1 FL=1